MEPDSSEKKIDLLMKLSKLKRKIFQWSLKAYQMLQDSFTYKCQQVVLNLDRNEQKIWVEIIDLAEFATKGRTTRLFFQIVMELIGEFSEHRNPLMAQILCFGIQIFTGTWHIPVILTRDVISSKQVLAADK